MLLIIDDLSEVKCFVIEEFLIIIREIKTLYLSGILHAFDEISVCHIFYICFHICFFISIGRFFEN
jgi:hypothetical protein